MITQQGAINTTALVVPGLYVQIVPPTNLVLNGVPTNILGVVGTAQWGPVNTATIVGSMADYAAKFGAIQPRKYDMGTHVAVAVQQGAQNFRCVRITDNTDLAAAVSAVSNCISFTALYSGTLGNSITVSLSSGSRVGTLRATIAIPGLPPEQFDNIAGAGPPWVPGGTPTVNQVVSNGGNSYTCTIPGTSAGSGGPSGTGSDIVDGSAHWAYLGSVNVFWLNLANAINTGTSTQRGPSQFVTATAGAGTTAPVIPNSYALAGGTDGVGSISESVLIGQDTAPRKGMYALRSQGCSIGILADADGGSGGAFNQWNTQSDFGEEEGIYIICTGPASDTPSNAIAIKQASGLDSPWVKLMFGDWLWWSDQTNSTMRLVSPQAFVAGRLANLSPEQSSLNKQLYGILGSQKSGLPGSSQFQTYTQADLQALMQAGIDVIGSPSPGGSYWSVQAGHNSSSVEATHGDNYTRMTDYLATTLNAGMGSYVGRTITTALFGQIRATLLAFLQNLLGQGLLGSLDGSLPFSVACDLTNNPSGRTSLGYMQVDVAVTYLAVNEFFLINLQGGQTVVVQRQTLPSGQITG